MRGEGRQGGRKSVELDSDTLGLLRGQIFWYLSSLRGLVYFWENLAFVLDELLTVLYFHSA